MERRAEIRRNVLTGAMSKREACRHYDIHWLTLKKILAHEEPPGYRRARPPRRPKIDPVLPIIQAILDADVTAPKKQRHTAHRIWQRLRDEHGFPGGYTIVKDAVREMKAGRQEVFLPLAHPPGEAQVDFGFAEVLVRGAPAQVAVFVLSLPYADAVYCQVFPRECTHAVVHRGVLGGTRAGVRLLRRRAPADHLRQRQGGGGQDHRQSLQAGHPRVPAAAEPLPVRPALLPGPAPQREGACRAPARLRPV